MYVKWREHRPGFRGWHMHGRPRFPPATGHERRQTKCTYGLRESKRGRTSQFAGRTKCTRRDTWSPDHLITALTGCRWTLPGSAGPQKVTWSGGGGVSERVGGSSSEMGRVTHNTQSLCVFNPPSQHSFGQVSSWKCHEITTFFSLLQVNLP